jgi:curved DNA-binding protein CbpA
MSSDDLYELLQVSPTADLGVIQAAYRRLALKYHPDRNPHSDEALAMMQKINGAYAVLRDGPRRSEYDNLRNHHARKLSAPRRQRILRKQDDDALHSSSQIKRHIRRSSYKHNESANHNHAAFVAMIVLLALSLSIFMFLDVFENRDATSSRHPYQTTTVIYYQDWYDGALGLPEQTTRWRQP